MDRPGPIASSEEKPARLDAVAEIRNAGERLKQLLIRYDDLVTRFTDARLPVPDLGGRIDWLNLQVAAAAEHLQELIVLEGDESRPLPFRRRREKPDAPPRQFAARRVVAGRI